MWRVLLGAILGIVSAMVVVAIVESIGHAIYPPPADLSFEDSPALRDYVASLPLHVFLFVLAAYILGTLTGSSLAVWIASRTPYVSAGIVAAFMLLATGMNLVMIPHPLWFSIVAITSIPLTAVLVARRAARHADGAQIDLINKP